jgi:hypothetical protein
MNPQDLRLRIIEIIYEAQPQSLVSTIVEHAAKIEAYVCGQASLIPQMPKKQDTHMHTDC